MIRNQANNILPHINMRNTFKQQQQLDNKETININIHKLSSQERLSTIPENKVHYGGNIRTFIRTFLLSVSIPTIPTIPTRQGGNSLI